MPELPEVETVVRGLRPSLRGAKVTSVWWSGLPLRMLRAPDVPALERLCAGGLVSQIHRRGKYILMDFGRASGRASGTVLVHLGMSGQLRLEPAAAERAAHTHVVWRLGGGRELRFVDPRRFGWVGVAASATELPELSSLGPDPLAELDAEKLALSLAGSRAPIKAFLLDQSKVAGLGNIYVSEALHRAGIHPGTPARRACSRAAALMDGIRVTLELGIRNRGTTLRDYRDADGQAGNNAAALLVYGRGGDPCHSCGNAIRRTVDAGRATYFCTRCQRR